MKKLNICIMVFSLLFSFLNADDQSGMISAKKENADGIRVDKLDISFFNIYGENRNEIIKKMGEPIKIKETKSDGIYFDNEIILEYPGISFKIWKKQHIESIQEIRISDKNIEFINNIGVGQEVGIVLSYFGAPSEKMGDYFAYINHLMILSFSFSDSGIIEEIYMVKQI